MAFVLGDEIDQGIRIAFQKDSSQLTNQDDEIRNTFKEHKKLLVKHQNRKWDVSFLETYINHRIVPRGLRDHMVPAEHLHNERFLPKWKEPCINHGIAVMGLIVEEEKIQLDELKEMIDASAQGLDSLKELEEFTKQNDILKKELERVQLNLKTTKQSKFRRDLADFEKNQVFDLTIRRGRSRSNRRGQRSQSRGRQDRPMEEQDDDGVPQPEKIITVQEPLETDMKVINLSAFPLAPRHINLLQKGMSFSPVDNMDKFTVYKDVSLFLRKVFFRSIYQSIPE